MTYYTYLEWQELDDGDKFDYETQLFDKFGLDLNDVAGIYIEDREVVGAMRFVLEEGERKLVDYEAVVELVGRDS